MINSSDCYESDKQNFILSQRLKIGPLSIKRLFHDFFGILYHISTKRVNQYFLSILLFQMTTP
jgi:hypothetical protein